MTNPRKECFSPILCGIFAAIFVSCNCQGLLKDNYKNFTIFSLILAE